jgi:hypothetical protein
MDGGNTNIACIEVPSDDPLFLAIVALHVLFGFVCVVSGIWAMLTVKGLRPRGRGNDLPLGTRPSLHFGVGLVNSRCPL